MVTQVELTLIFAPQHRNPSEIKVLVMAKVEWLRSPNNKEGEVCVDRLYPAGVWQGMTETQRRTDVAELVSKIVWM